MRGRSHCVRQKLIYKKARLMPKACKIGQHSPFENLHESSVLSILQQLEPEAFINLAFVHYYRFHWLSLTPMLDQKELSKSSFEYSAAPHSKAHCCRAFLQSYCCR